MTNKNLLACAVLGAAALVSCDDTTDTLGQTLTPNADIFSSQADTFKVNTRSITVDSVLSRGQYSYIGHVKDTETGTYVTSNLTTQFAILEDIFRNEGYFPEIDSMASVETVGGEKLAYADSCRLRLYINTYVGDSLNAMRLTAYEMARPVSASETYYTDFDPLASGMLRTDGNAIVKSKWYTPIDLTLSDSVRALLSTSGSSYYKPITIPLNEPYTDREGNTYGNYGTYILRTYYKHPEYFKNSVSFARNVCPGFYVKSTGGVGVMSQIYMGELAISYSYYAENDSGEVVKKAATTQLMGTEEVMHTTSVVNDKERIAQLAASDTCTYLKAPAGIFTEVELPVEDIMYGHERDTLSSAKVVFQAMNASDEENQFSIPEEVMILPKDSLYSFFENGNLPDNILSYMATYSSSYNTYTFSNIAGLVTSMWQNRGKDANWNKAVLVPVTRTYSSTSSSSTSSAKLVSVSNEMSLKSVRLVGGPNNDESRHTPITISVIYNKFSER